jgi:4-hydroxybenzoate polyprenyltransferase
MLKTLLVYGAFCLVASSIYILNDYIDREDDRKHPAKRFRPLAAGTVSEKTALIAMFLLALTGSLISLMVGVKIFYFIATYIIINILYSFKLKHIAIIDVFIISIGFILRLFIGASVGNIPLSMWIVLMTFLLALFLAFAKRRDDVLLALEGTKTRKSIDGYNLEFINGAMTIMAAVVIVSYIFYTISPDVQDKHQSKSLYLTVFFVLLGVLRYMQITFVEGKSGSPTKVLIKDVFLQLVLLGWLGSFIFLIYFHVSL